MATCPTCGAEAQVGQRFCAECGTKLTVARPRAAEGDGSNVAPRRPADIGAGGFRWNASAPTPPAEVVGRAREEAQQQAAPSDGDDFFARYRPKAASPSAPEADEAGEAEEQAAPEPQSYLRSRRRFNPDLRATGERDIISQQPPVIPTPARPRTPEAPAASQTPLDEPTAARTEEPAEAPADAPAAKTPSAPARDAFVFEPPTTEFDVLPMNTPPARAAEQAPAVPQDEQRGQVPSWFSELEGSGDPAPADPAPAASAPSAPAPSAPAGAPPQFGRPPERADAAPAAAAQATPPSEPSVERPAEVPPRMADDAPRIPSFRAEPPAAPTPRVVPSPPPMPATGDPFRGASAAPVFPSGPAVVPGEPPRAAPAASSAFDELLAGERSDGSVLDDSDRPIVSRDFEQTGIVPLPSRKRESFGEAQDSQRQDAAELFGAAAAPADPAAQAGPAPRLPQASSETPAEPATRALPRQDTGPAFDEGQRFDEAPSGVAGAPGFAGAAGAAGVASGQADQDFSTPTGPKSPRREQDPARELLSSWFDEDDADEQPAAAASGNARAPRRPEPAAGAPRMQTGAAPRTTASGVGASDEPDLEPSDRNPFDRVGAALGGGSGGGGGRMGAAVRGLDNRNRRRLGVIALSVVGSILLIISAIMIGNVVGANRDDPVADGEPAASETAAEQSPTEEPAPPAGPAAVADPNFAPVTFASETGNIRCEITPETGVACQQYTVNFEVPEQVCEAGATGVVVGLDSNGYTFPCLTEDIPLEGAVIQPYNSPVVLGEFVCEITFETGVTCFNASGDIVSVEYSAGVGQAGRLSATNPTPGEGQ